MAKLTLSDLTTLVENAAAICGKATLMPAVDGDKVFPPTHLVESKKPSAGEKYAFENRRIGGVTTTCVLLDSVQSQANRMEKSLQDLWAVKKLRLPVVVVDFTKSAGLTHFGTTISSLTAPHRIADALLRDSMLDETLFRHSDFGQSFSDATTRDASSLFKVCPTGLLFGIWDSTGPKGGLGAKFARVITSEVIGIDAVHGVKTSSRIDPTGQRSKVSNPIFVAADLKEQWTRDPKLAAKDKNGPQKKGDGKTTDINHSNQPPLKDIVGGGVTIDRAEHSVVISLAGLRKIGFGSEIAAPARTVLAALGLLSVLAAQRDGYDFRSRCLLLPVPGKALQLESVDALGNRTAIELSFSDALALYHDAVTALPTSLAFASEAGEALATLVPSPKLEDLIRESMSLAVGGEDDGQDET